LRHRTTRPSRRRSDSQSRSQDPTSSRQWGDQEERRHSPPWVSRSTRRTTSGQPLPQCGRARRQLREAPGQPPHYNLKPAAQDQRREALLAAKRGSSLWKNYRESSGLFDPIIYGRDWMTVSLDYSSRNAMIGSMRLARRAGHQIAAAAARTSVSDTTARVGTSVG
jgi:hypothetical protein